VKNYIVSDSGCWEWKGTLNAKGYGRITSQGRRMYAHRYSWIVHRGDIPDGLCVLHDCDNAMCVNPDHLHLGTKEDNNREMAERNRSQSGSSRYNAKLDEGKVREIRTRYSTGTVSQHALARDYGVSAMAINRAINGTRWRKVVV
jgi:hypothetical protein